MWHELNEVTHDSIQNGAGNIVNTQHRFRFPLLFLFLLQLFGDSCRDGDKMLSLYWLFLVFVFHHSINQCYTSLGSLHSVAIILFVQICHVFVSRLFIGLRISTQPLRQIKLLQPRNQPETSRSSTSPTLKVAGNLNHN